MAREYFNAYHSYLKSMEPLDDAECGRLFRAMLEYSETGATPELIGNERFVFPTMKQQIDRDAKRYDDKCEKNRYNVLQRYTNVNDGIRTSTKSTKTKEKTKEKEKTKTNDNPPIPPQGVERFEQFWKAYPKKVGKKDALKSFEKVKPSAALLSKMLKTIEQSKASPQWKKENGQYIPNPATWLNQGRWDDELPGVKDYTDEDDFVALIGKAERGEL